MPIFPGHARVAAMASILLAVPSLAVAAGPSTVDRLRQEARALEPLVDSDIGQRFLQAARDLPSVASPRIVYYDQESREALSESEIAALTGPPEGYERLELDEEYYYTTRYGTPLAFVRALDLVGQAGLSRLAGARIVDFGFGSIGQLRILASLGAEAVGIEVDDRLRVLYGEEGDTGRIPPASVAAEGASGSIALHFGRYPASEDIREAVGGDFALFVSKNTLKRGYIHPEQQVDPRMLVHLGVDDATYVDTLFDILQPGGYAMIYNLHPAAAEEGEPYIPWADGRCPFSRELLEDTGFRILAFDQDDTAFARSMGQALGWDEQMNLDTDLFATWTLLQRPER
jgi:hypothetical protein